MLCEFDCVFQTRFSSLLSQATAGLPSAITYSATYVEEIPQVQEMEVSYAETRRMDYKNAKLCCKLSERHSSKSNKKLEPVRKSPLPL